MPLDFVALTRGKNRENSGVIEAVGARSMVKVFETEIDNSVSVKVEWDDVIRRNLCVGRRVKRFLLRPDGLAPAPPLRLPRLQGRIC